jgi:hypothetical protein
MPQDAQVPRFPPLARNQDINATSIGTARLR